MTTYILTTDYIRKNFANNTLTLSCQKMKSKNGVLMVKPAIYFVNTSKQTVIAKTSPFWVIGTSYKPYSFELTLTDAQLESTAYIRIIFRVFGLSGDNALAFNHLQLAEGSVTDYHQPEQDIPKTRIRFANSFYANLYTSNDDSYLQVIRPYYTNMDTETLSKSKATVIAPHLRNEDEIDSPSNLGLEFMNQTDQVIEILR